MSLTEAMEDAVLGALEFVAGESPAARRLGAWLDARPWACAGLLALAVVLGGLIEGGAL